MNIEAVSNDLAGRIAADLGECDNSGMPEIARLKRRVVVGPLVGFNRNYIFVGFDCATGWREWLFSLLI